MQKNRNQMSCIVWKIVYRAAFALLIVAAGCSGINTRFPVLIIATDAGFGSYTGELLKTEGFHAFLIDSLNDKKMTASYLRQFDLVILTESEIDDPGRRLVFKYVREGGNLIAFRPDTVLSEMFGIKPSGGNIADGYIAVDPETEQGRGLTSRPMQFHGTADKYSVKTANTIATISTGKSASQNGFPGVVSNDYGKGHAVAFLYNLPKSNVYTRQGNPLHAGIEKDGIPGLRSMDLFTGGWLDYFNNTINQADEQLVLLSHCIEKMAGYTKPLPRLWYFPDTLKCLVTLTNDGEYSAEPDFEQQFTDVDAMGARMTLYVLETQKITKGWVDKWTGKGFEISGHPDDTREAAGPKWENMHAALNAKSSEIKNLFGLSAKTVTNHWFVWCGNDREGRPEFAAQAEIEAAHGLRIDCNYAHYDNNSSQGHFLGTMGVNQGNFTGSGMVMKFAGANGKIFNIYQHLNNVYDQQYYEHDDADGFFNCFKGLIDRSIEDGIYSFVSIKSHNDEYHFSKEPLLRMLDYAKRKQVPVWTAANLADFMLMKDEATFSDIRWAGGQLRFKLASSVANENGLTFMLPVRYGSEEISRIVVNRENMPVNHKLIKGCDYAFVTVAPGNDYEVTVSYDAKVI